MFETGLGLLTRYKTDTLNKNEQEPIDTSLKIFSIDPETGETEPLVISQSEEDLISENQPAPLTCNCVFTGDTLKIASGITLFSGFIVMANLIDNKADALYVEHSSQEDAFKTELANEKVNEIAIPATIDQLVIDRWPKKGITELYGKMAVTTSSYYTYINVWDFKNDYIHQRMKIELYFKCTIEK